MASNNLSSSVYKRSYNSFSGVDIQATFGGKLIADLQGLSWNIQREKAPVYTFGSADPRSFSRGKRGIAGSMVFHVFDRDSLLDRMRNDNQFLANRYELLESAVFSKVFDLGAQSGLLNVSTFLDANVGSGDSNFGPISVTIDKVVAKPWYVDQIPPFDIVINAANEYGHLAQKSIIGVEILNAGSGVSIDDITIDEAMTYVARKITPWRNQVHIDKDTGLISDTTSEPFMAG